MTDFTPYPLKGNASGRTAHVYNVSGMLVRTLPLQGTKEQVTVSAGIYIVRIGNAIEKVVVR
ncbi:MAG TPA: T9SS type A sorting domain-containing protein [Paludibacteraceae bacterium]|nr:T9SS type A sorting domain-containing protein [Paludibacteraceae bacterium]HOS37321.1 T9SS type A sorting domain-containing protein [Paludibacteraceae bacterium]HPK20103.1 T9SS type A sorting domain-containing protein [Paludibacteraceae bacterium]